MHRWKARIKICVQETPTTCCTLEDNWNTTRSVKRCSERIRSDEEGVNDYLQEMLSEWLKQTDPLPTWSALAEAVEMVDSSKAKEIRDHCLDIPNT